MLLESAPQTLSNDTIMNHIRPILIKLQQFEKLIHRFLNVLQYLQVTGIRHMVPVQNGGPLNGA